MDFRTLRILILLTLAGVPRIVSATTVIPPDFAELVAEADTILLGDVESIESQWTVEGSDRFITSNVRIDVLEVLKGSAGDTYDLVLLGGRIGDRVQQIAEFRPYRIGERVVVFVAGNGTNLIPVVRLAHGSFELKPQADGTEAVLKHDGVPLESVAEIGKEEARAAVRRPAIRRQAFIQQIRESVLSNRQNGSNPGH